MRTVHRTRTAIATTGAVAALLIGGAAAPATAAGNGAEGRSDRGSSHAAHRDGPGHDGRWQAQADPDGDENGGVDQPGGSGGVNTDDQDGNNGSGNDSDCEDDNRGKGVPGHCKDKKQPAPVRGLDQGEPAKDRPSGAEEGSTGSAPRDVATGLPGDTADEGRDAEVKGIAASAPSSPSARPLARAAASPEAAASPAAAEGSEAASADSTGVLPNTGAEAAMLAMLLGGLTAAGAGTVLIRRRAQAD